MLGVTVTASQPRIIVCECAMQGGNLAHLLGNVGVATGAAVCHGRCFPGRSMAGFALPACLRVGGDASQGLLSLRTQRPGVIHQAAAREGIARDD